MNNYASHNLANYAVKWDEFHSQNIASLMFIKEHSCLMQYNTLPGSGQAAVASTLLRGMVITAFNRLEALIQNYSAQLIESINSSAISYTPLSARVSKSLSSAADDALSSIAKNRFLDDYERQVLRDQHIEKLYESSKYKKVWMSTYSFFNSSNINEDELSRFLGLCIDVIRARFETEVNGKGQKAARELLFELSKTMNMNNVSLNLGADRVNSFRNIFDKLAGSRHKAAHTEVFSFNVDTVHRYIKSVDTVGSLLKYCYLILESAAVLDMKEPNFLCEIKVRSINHAMMGVMDDFSIYSRGTSAFYTSGFSRCKAPVSGDPRILHRIPSE